MHVDAEQRRKVVEFKNIAVANFSSSNWIELGSLTDRFDLVNDHPRLLRSLSFGDDDWRMRAPGVDGDGGARSREFWRGRALHHVAFRRRR